MESQIIPALGGDADDAPPEPKPKSNRRRVLRLNALVDPARPYRG